MEFNVASTIVSAGTGAALGAFANALMQGRARWLDTQMLAAALAREVMMCGRKLAAWRYEIQREHQIGLSKTRVAPCPLAFGDLAIYQGNASNLGKLPPWLIIRTMQTYERFRSFSAAHGSEQFMERPECEALLRRIHHTLKGIDAQVFTELEVLAATPYWKMWQLRFDAWRSKNLMRDTGCA
jgi:ribonuclease D